MSSALWFVAGFVSAYVFSALAFLGPLALGRWLARRRIKRAVRELIATGRWHYSRSEW